MTRLWIKTCGFSFCCVFVFLCPLLEAMDSTPDRMNKILECYVDFV